MITKLSNHELNTNLKRLVATERKILNSILDHINEVESRKLYLEMAYPTLYEYLVKECGYSGSAAMRRISAARLVKEIPTAAVQIQDGSLNLSQIGELSRAIKEKEKSGHVVTGLMKSKIVSAISGQSTEQTQKVIARELDLDLKLPERTLTQKDDSVHLQITLTQEQFQKLLKCKDAAAAVLLKEEGDVSLAAVVNLLADQFLSQKKLAVPAEVSREATHEKQNANRTLTPKTKQAIINRDLCCQFKDPHTGKICASTFNLEVDHKQPRWADGSHTMSNLQTLCRSHNNYKYKKETNLRLL